VTELRLIAKDPACLSEATCPALLAADDLVFVVGQPATLPEDAPSGVGPGEAVVTIPAALLEQAVQAELNRMAHEAAHWQDVADLREHHAELRARQTTSND
jgi:hypothetical protein